MPDAAERNPEFFEGAVEEMALSEKCFKFRMWPGNGPRKLSDEELAGLQMPVLYVVGENERICSDVQLARSRAASAPTVLTAVIPSAGHDALWVSTGAVQAAVLPFLNAKQ
jgi:pimeloyl-ACP methyl ester carboxylesterase